MKLDRNRHEGGVTIYCYDIDTLELEMVCIEIKSPRAKPFLVISRYRPPSDNVETIGKLECVLRSLEFEDKERILLGEDNCDYSVILQESSMAIITILSY